MAGHLTGSCSCIQLGHLRRAFICLGRPGRVCQSIRFCQTTRLIKVIGGPTSTELQPKAETNEPLS